MGAYTHAHVHPHHERVGLDGVCRPLRRWCTQSAEPRRSKQAFARGASACLALAGVHRAVGRWRCLPKRPARIEQPSVHAVELVGREACAKQHCAIERGICESAPPLATDTWAAPRHCDSFWIRPNPNLLRRKEKNGA